MDKAQAKAQFALSGAETEFTLIGMKGWARIVACHDGDTITMVFPVLGKMFKFNVRLYGIDTCEMTSKGACQETAIKARNRLIELITGLPIQPNASLNRKDIMGLFAKEIDLVWVECMEMDKYGRVLANLRGAPDAPNTFADILLDEKLAYKYFGATKLTEAEQMALLKN